MPDAANMCVPVPLRVVEPAPATVPGGLQYDAADPYAVRLLIFEAPTREWQFGRDLLAAGLTATVRAPAGLGEVRVWRQWRGARHMMHLWLCSPEGWCVLALPASTVIGFLRVSYLLVPRGTESERIDWDAVVAELLAGDAPC